MNLSIVMPCYNEAASLPELYRRLCAVLERIPGQVEFIFVNDGSRDATPQILADLVRRDRRAVAINLSRNFGHQAALTAGIDHARGDAVVVLDADLQHPTVRG
jgi:dolichol-phosphate mannosyltransferase